MQYLGLGIKLYRAYAFNSVSKAFRYTFASKYTDPFREVWHLRGGNREKAIPFLGLFAIR